MNISSVNSIISETQKAISNDGKLDKNELKNLKNLISNSDLDPKAKDSAIKFLEQTKKESFFGISNKDLSQLSSLAQSLPDSEIAKKLCNTVESTLVSRKSIDSNLAKSRLSSPESANKLSFPDKSSKAGGTFTKEAANVSKWHTPQFAEYEKQYGNFWDNFSNMREKTSNANGGPKAGLTGQEAEWRKAYSSCGPTCVDMVLKAKGFDDKNIEQLRNIMGENKYGSTDADNVVKGIERGSGGKLDANKISVKTNAQDFIAKMRDEINKGNMPVMLSAFISDNKPSGGHYVVINGVKDDGTLVIANPYSKNHTEEIPFSKLQEAFNYRKANPKSDGDDNVIVSIRNK